LKGEDIMHFLGLPEYVIDIQDWLHSPWQVLSQAGSILEDLEKSKAKVRETSERAIAENRSLLSNLLENWVSNST
jgi:polysaccharide pyruvyl transferase WcaK-like protein